jgi:hypothetical protein
MIVKVNVGRAILAVDDYVYEVHVYHPSMTKLQKNHGYIIRDQVYIYKGKSKPDGMGIYKNKDTGELMVVEGTTKEKENFRVDKVIDMDIESIANRIKEQADRFTSEEDLEVMNYSAEVFAPKIKEDDDFLKQIVKQALEEKQISIKHYKNKFSKPHTLNNIKSALINKTKTSINNFEQWAELLGFDWEIRIFDNGQDKQNPMDVEIVFRSDEGLKVEKR